MSGDCMSGTTAFCGIDCSNCEALVATRENDDNKRKAVAEKWSKAFGQEIKAQEINCDGCVTMDGRHINYCNICEIRKCGAEKNVKNCAFCDDYKCEKLKKFHEGTPEAKNRLEAIRKEKW